MYYAFPAASSFARARARRNRKYLIKFTLKRRLETAQHVVVRTGIIIISVRTFSSKLIRTPRPGDCVREIVHVRTQHLHTRTHARRRRLYVCHRLFLRVFTRAAHPTLTVVRGSVSVISRRAKISSV